MRNFIKWMGLLCGCLAMLSCTSMEPVPANSGYLRRNLQEGKQVEVTKTDGQHLDFKVNRVDKDGVSGPGIKVPYGEIKTINQEQYSWWKNGLIGLGVVAVGVIAISASKSGGGGGSGGGW